MAYLRNRWLLLAVEVKVCHCGCRPTSGGYEARAKIRNCGFCIFNPWIPKLDPQNNNLLSGRYSGEIMTFVYPHIDTIKLLLWALGTFVIFILDFTCVLRSDSRTAIQSIDIDSNTGIRCTSELCRTS